MAQANLLLDLHARWPDRYPALLESAARSDTLGRHDLLFAFPQRKLVKDMLSDESFLATIDAQMRAEAAAPIGPGLHEYYVALRLARSPQLLRETSLSFFGSRVGDELRVRKPVL